MDRIINIENTVSLEDDKLIVQILSGNINAENTLYKKYYPLILSKVSPGIGIYDAEDIVQDTMVIVVTSIKNGKYIHKQALYSYISGISWNLRNKFFKNIKYNSPINEFENITEINCYPDSIEITKQKRIRFIIKALNNLDPLCDKLLTYSFFSGLKPRQIIGLMPEFNTSVQVTKRKYKCLEKLKRKVKKLM
ncbi:MAG: sigma-70 family RNA polymerase sigma factor [Chlorobi bacterium]|nr:sigma-70 family RNA polymerase sigma factor [Chlorobiota bacterium]